MQQPAKISGQLLRLRPWQKHAKIQRMQESGFVDPFLFVKLPGNLSGYLNLVAGRIEARNSAHAGLRV